MDKELIVDKILNSKKYRDIYRPTVERIVSDSIKKYGSQGESRVEKESRELMHQVWGAFYSNRPDFDKLLRKFSDLEIESEEDHSRSRVVEGLLRIHTSTVERMKFIEEFYQKIFEITGIPKTIQDIGCGFTPLSIEYMKVPSNIKYKAYDIDLAEIEFLNEISKIVFPEYDLTFKPADILIDKFEKSDVIFLLKTLPILERQKKGATEYVLDNLKCKFMVVSFPLKSLSGREVGMARFYSENFEEILSKRKLKFHRLEFSNELVYVIKSKR